MSRYHLVLRLPRRLQCICVTALLIGVDAAGDKLLVLRLPTAEALVQVIEGCVHGDAALSTAVKI